MDAVSEIKSRISIHDLVSQYVPLKKVGRNFKALCPFHKERTPSFYVSPERQFAYCFGCHKGGDHFTFIQEMEGLDFRGALKFLADKAGVDLPKALPQEKERKSERDRLMQMHAAAADYFADKLANTSDGKKVFSYLKKRDLSEDTIKKTGLGFAPDAASDLYSFLLKKGYSKPEIIASGLVIARDTAQAECFDRFRMRLIFPISNLAGAVCAFGGRAVREGDEPKYLNSPETPVYHKSSLLYLLSEARAEIRSKGFVILVEGYMDALSVHQAGFKNAVACSGTSLTADQLNVLKRFTSEVVFAFDRDEAGRKAAVRAIELGISQELNVRVAAWEDSFKDPDECVRRDPKIFEDAVKNAKPALTYLLESFAGQFDLKSIEGKKKLTFEFLPFINKIASPIEIDAWLKELSQVLSVSLSSLYEELKRYRLKQKSIGFQTVSEKKNEMPRKIWLSAPEYLLAILLTYPETYSLVKDIIKPEDFEDIELQNIYRTLTTQYNQTLEGNDDQLKHSERANVLSIFAETRLSDMTWDVLEKEVLETLRTFLKHKFDRTKHLFIGKLGQASGRDRERLIESYQELLAQENQLLKDLLWPKNSRNS